MQDKATPRTSGSLHSIPERIYSILALDHADGLLEPAAHVAPFAHPFTGLERDLLDWGVIYGMCFALARQEDPWETTEQVGGRASELAKLAYGRWGGGFAARSRVDHEGAIDAAREVVFAHREAPYHLDGAFGNLAKALKAYDEAAERLAKQEVASKPRLGVVS